MTNELSKTKKALIVVDVQNDFIDGSLAVDGGEQAAQRIATLIADVQGPIAEHRAYALVVTTQDFHIDPGEHFSESPDFKDTWPVHAVAGTPGAELSPRLTSVLDRIDASFYKGRHSAAYSGFEAVGGSGHAGGHAYGTGLAVWLRQHGITDVDVVGIATDYCVKATALDAVKEGFTTRVLLPLTAAVAPESNEAARKEMTEAGVVLASGGTVL